MRWRGCLIFMTLGVHRDLPSFIAFLLPLAELPTFNIQLNCTQFSFKKQPRGYRYHHTTAQPANQQSRKLQIFRVLIHLRPPIDQYYIKRALLIAHSTLMIL